MPPTFKKPTDTIKTQLRQLIRLLFKLQETSRYTSSKSCCHRCCFDMSKSYISRCWLLLTIFLISAAISIAFGIVIYMKGDMYSCTYNLKVENEYYICTTDVALRIAFFNLAGGSVYLLQMLPTGWGIWKAKKAVKSVNGNSMEYPVIRLILTFWRSSTSSNSGLLRECIEEFVFSGRFYKAVVENEDAPDTEMPVIENGDATDTDLTELARFMERAFSPLSVLTYKHRKYNAELFREFIRKSEYELNECFWLAELLAKHELWETFVILLEKAKDLTSVKENDKTMKRFERLNVNFDSLASADAEVERLDNDFYDKKTVKKSNNTHSLLYYATDVKRKGVAGQRENLNVADFLLLCFKPMEPYVHHRSGDKCNSQKYTQLAIPRGQDPKNFRCQQVLQEELNKYKLMTELDKHKSRKKQNKDKSMEKLDKDKSLEKLRPIFPEIVARRKFRIWDENAVTFFKLAIENNDDEMKMALFRAYFLDKGGCAPSDQCINEIINGVEHKYAFNDCIKLLDNLLENGKLDLCVKLLNKADWTDPSLPSDWKKRLDKVNIKYNKKKKKSPFRLERDQNTDNVPEENAYSV